MLAKELFELKESRAARMPFAPLEKRERHGCELCRGRDLFEREVSLCPKPDKEIGQILRARSLLRLHVYMYTSTNVACQGKF